MLKTQYTYDRYYKYDELTAVLQKFVADNPGYCKLDSILHTPEGREMWCLAITNTATGDYADKPGFLVDGNIHAGEVTGCMATLYYVDTLLSNKDDKSIEFILNNYTVYAIPRIAIDGSEYYLNTPYSLRSAPRMYPFDQLMPGVQPEDIDGDGVIRQMRVKTPLGAFKISDVDPRLMTKRLADDVEGDFYDIYSEGVVEQFDGLNIQPAPGKFGNDMNRNFPIGWKGENGQPGAGDYALANPETKAIADFCNDNRNLCVAMNFHTSGGQHLFPPAYKSSKQAEREDMEHYRTIGKIANEITGYPVLNILDDYIGNAQMGAMGSMDDYQAFAMGIMGMTTELWDLRGKAGHKLVWPRPAKTDDKEEAQVYLDEIKWLQDNGFGDRYMEWTKFNHPQLGEVEIGGLDSKYTIQNAPGLFLQEECEKLTQFMLRLVKVMPRLTLTDAKATKLSDGKYLVEATVNNNGFLPTYVMKEAITLKRHLGITATITGGKVIVGKAEEKLGELGGFSGKQGRSYGPNGATSNHMPLSKKVEWVVEANEGDTVTVTACCYRAGKATATITL